LKGFVLAVFLLTLAVSAYAKTHRDIFSVPCSVLWPALKDTLRNSGKYGIIGIDSTEMTASYNIGGGLAGKRINSAVLNTVGTGCEMQVQTAFSGLVNNDAGDLKKRVEESLAKLQAAQATPSTKAEAATSQPATAENPKHSAPSPIPQK
jgi:uncharacterized protein YqfA (UPF0365 family)